MYRQGIQEAGNMQAIPCPNCQTINPANAKFCLECGKRLLVCPNCGTVNPSAAKFCIECGTALRPQGEYTAPLPTSQPARVETAQTLHETRSMTAPLLPPEERQAQDPEATRLQMRIGINTGEVAIPSSTQHQRQDFLITGDAVNVAARLQQVATPDTILVGERTYLATREVFDFSAMAPLNLKGKPEPVTAYVVLGLCKRTPMIPQHPRGISGRQAPLIGRSLELTLLHTHFARVQNERQPHFITLIGAPGVGKSRLVREFIAREQESAKSASASGRISD